MGNGSLTPISWRPSASLETLQARAALLARIRAFFLQRGVLEVETPIASRHATVDVHIDSVRTADGRWLHTSPEFAMKRLLAAGSGPIWQLCRVFRAGDEGRLHNPEFTMLEWYQPGWDHHRLMDEVGDLLAELGAPRAQGRRLTFREAWLEHAGIDPFNADMAGFAKALGRHYALPDGYRELGRDGWLDFGMGFVVGPRLGLDAPCFLHDFPASQAALARVRPAALPGEPPLAERFELFWRGLELANGFHELGDAAEQKRRFEADQQRRAEERRVVPPFDANLVDALAAGFPSCAGVALGIDRLVMLLLGLPDVASAMAFDWTRA